MTFRHRLALWISAAAMVYMLDVLTKAAGFGYSVGNYTTIPAFALALAAGFLLALLAVRSTVIAFGAGVMFGALCGNGGQLIVEGHVSDWLRVGPVITNVADIASAVGLILCLFGYVHELRQTTRQT